MIKTDRTFVQLFFFLLLSFFCILLLHSCKNYHRNSTHAEVSLSSIEKGEALAKIYCKSHHMLPEPSLLDTKSWEKGVLPEMGPRLGIFSYGFEMYHRIRDLSIGADFYPSHPLINVNEWQNIIDYYVATSPDSLPPQKRKDSIKTGLSLFKVQIPNLNYENSATCYVKINSRDSIHPLIIYDAIKQNIYFINPKLAITDSVRTAGPVVDIEFIKIICLPATLEY